MKRFVLLVGARPNFMKIAPLDRALLSRGVRGMLVHTGQHYDANMSDVFFEELGIRKPDVYLGVGSGDRLVMTQKIVQSLSPILAQEKPDALVVVGDVTSTLAGTLAAISVGVPVAHVEAGLRSFNWRMPEELNRLVTDHYSSWLFVSEPSGLKHLPNESISHDGVHHVGNIMIDTLRHVEARTDLRVLLQKFQMEPNQYGLVTLHRPENVDHRSVFELIWSAFSSIASRLPLIFPVHPRTRKQIQEMGFQPLSGLHMIDPIGYSDMLSLTKHARVVITDSGGLQEEATVLGVPCITLREQTERPITVEIGTSEIAGPDPEKILTFFDRVMRGEWKKGKIPDLWDGHTAERIADILLRD